MAVKKPARKRNPVKKHGSAKQSRVVKAMQLYQRFRLADPKYIDEMDVEFHDVLMEIGRCDGVLYTTRRNGVTEKYIHEFTGKSRPILAASWDGKQLYFIGGAYDFTDEGIIDRK